jgi:hypothetical protein
MTRDYLDVAALADLLGEDASVKALVLVFVEPEIEEAKALWRFLLDTMPPVESVEPLQATGSSR